jgi:DNA-binding transcriptional MerR regulator
MSAKLVEIGAVARELGIAPSTLRSWERRYRLVVPQRAENGHRLYDSEQVHALRRVRAQIHAGARAKSAHAAASLSAPIRTMRVRIENAPDAPSRARQAVDALLENDGTARFAFNLRLVASELVTNAILHGSKQDSVWLDIKLFKDAAELKVRNRGARITFKDLRARRSKGGRGLEIVDALAEAWSVNTGPLGTTVTVRLAAPSPAGTDVPGASNGPVSAVTPD